jgi:dienelactone hydrolase
MLARTLLVAALAVVLAPTAGASVRLYDHGIAVVDDPYGPPRLVDLDAGRVHALYRTGSSFAIGSGFATRTPVRGRARFDARGATISGRRVRLIPLRTVQVRFPSDGASLAGTLMLPPGSGRHPAVAYVTGSGPTTREYLPELQALLLRHGVAVLAYDKRGIGASGGRYPGESPTQAAIDQLAADAAAAVRFLATRPEIDPARIGLAGHSQAGWIMPLAAMREPAVRFIVTFSGPAVTTDENDLYQTLAGQGDVPQRLSDAEVDARVERAGPGGVDPLPWIRALGVPALWLYGALDHVVPPRLSAKRLVSLAAEPGRDFTVATFPRANHALVETRTGLTSEMLRSDRYARGLFARVGAWLRAHGLS